MPHLNSQGPSIVHDSQGWSMRSTVVGPDWRDQSAPSFSTQMEWYSSSFLK